MKILFQILFYLILLSLIPIPIKFHILFNSNDYYVKLYRFFIIKKEEKKTKVKEEIPPSPPKDPVKKEEEKKKSFSIFEFLKERIEFIILYRNIRDNKYKPRLRVKGYFQYSFGDAAKTAISYGAFSAVAPIIYRGITLFFRSKKFYFPIEPLVDKESTINLKLDCIIFISIAQIINMFYIIFKSILETQEDKIYEQ